MNPKRQKKILVLGHLAKDFVETRDGVVSFWGGSAYHVALGASLVLEQGNVGVWSLVGDDFNLSELKCFGIDTKLIKVNKTCLTDEHWLGEEKGRVRSYKTKGKLSETLTIDYDSIRFGDIGWIHLCSAPPSQQLKWINGLEKVGLGHVSKSCDTFEKFTMESPRAVVGIFNKCELVFANDLEWSLINGSKTVNSKAIIKMGSKGAVIIRDGNIIEAVKTSKVEVVDTTGAGDVVAGVYLAMILRGYDDTKALSYACELATESVKDFGTKHLFSKRAGDVFVV